MKSEYVSSTFYKRERPINICKGAHFVSNYEHKIEVTVRDNHMFTRTEKD